jgi:hypothetical protein
MTEELLERLWEDAALGSVLSREAALGIERLVSEGMEREKELTRLATRNALLVTEIDSIRSSLKEGTLN